MSCIRSYRGVPESLHPKERRGLLGVLKQEMDLDAEHVDLEW
jgi:hypothetical protein